MRKYAEYLHGQVRRAADPVRPDRHHLARLLLLRPRPWGGRRARAGTIGSPRSCSRWSASCSRASSSTTGSISGRRLRHARAVPAARLGEGGRQAGRLGGLPDAQRQLGLRPRQPRLEVARHAGADAGRHRLQGRQPAAQRRSDRARRVRSAGAGDARDDRRVDAAARPLDLRRRAERVRAARRTAATRSAATGSTCTSSPGRSGTSTSTGWPAGSTTPSCSTTAPSEIRARGRSCTRGCRMSSPPAAKRRKPSRSSAGSTTRRRRTRYRALSAGVEWGAEITASSLVRRTEVQR